MRWLIAFCLLVPLSASAQQNTPAQPIPGTTVSVTSTATVVPSGNTWWVVTNATASGGGTLSLNMSGTAAVVNTGIVLQPGGGFYWPYQPVNTPVTGICSTGTCTVAVQAGK